MKASIQLLAREEKELLLGSALEILSSIGIRLPDSDRLPGLLNRSGLRIEEEILYFDGELVRWALETAPKSIPIFDRDERELFSLGGMSARDTRFGIGVTNLYYHDPQDGSIQPFTRESFRLAVRLGDRLSTYDFVSTPGILSDLPPERADLLACLEMAANTRKPLVVLISHKESFAKALDLIRRVGGTRRTVLPYFNPQTPLLFPADIAANLAEAVCRGLPVIFSNYSMLGASTPASLQGTASLLLAELLGGLALCQCFKEGAPVVLGSLPAVFDMRTAQSYYSPHSFLLNLAVHEVLADFGLPTCGTSGCEGGWGMDLRAAGELWFNQLTSMLGGIDLAPFVGSTFNSKVFSPELVVYADTIIRQARQFCEEVALEKEGDFLEEIRKAGHGGHFLDSEITLENFRRFISPDIFPRIGLEKWEQQKRPVMAGLLKEYTLDILSGLPTPVNSAELLATGEAWITAP